MKNARERNLPVQALKEQVYYPSYTFLLCVYHHFLALSITAKINLLCHYPLRAWCTVWDLF